jgi:hypothetical protein
MSFQPSTTAMRAVAAAASGASRTIPFVPSRRLLMRGICAALIVSPCRSFSADAQPEPTRVAVYGDSQAEGLAVALLAATRGGRFQIANRTKAGSALSQPVTYDWLAAIRRSVSSDHPAIAVMMFGGNDRVPARLPDGRALPFRGDAWLAFYRERLKTIISALTDAGTRIVWCGDPNTRDDRYAQDMEYLNTLYRDALPAADAAFVDIRDVAAGPGGAYASHGSGTDGVVQRLRTDDGIHFTAAGYGLVARRVLRAMEEIGTRSRPPPAEAPRGEARATAEAPAKASPPEGGANLTAGEKPPELHAGVADVPRGEN